LAFAAAVADVANSSWSFIEEISKGNSLSTLGNRSLGKSGHWVFRQLFRLWVSMSQLRVAYLFNVCAEKNPLPRVLVTHIPLYRPDDTPCGANRASPVINQVIITPVLF
jgi:hypothetical protein